MMFSDVQGILGVDLAEAKKSKKAASDEKKKVCLRFSYMNFHFPF